MDPYVKSLLEQCAGYLCAASLLIRQGPATEDSDLVANKLWDLGLAVEELLPKEA